MFKHKTTVTRRFRGTDSSEPAIMRPESNPPAGEIDFDDLRTSDTITIKTRNSAYTFSVTDETERRGTLTGGKLGAGAIEVKLLNVDGSRLKVGSRAMFLIESSDGVKRVSTSTITELSHQKTHQLG